MSSRAFVAAAVSVCMLGCARTPAPTGGSSATGARPTPASVSRDRTWNGVVVDHISTGILYFNDANLRDSTAAFEAVVVPRDLYERTGEALPAWAEDWSPSVSQLMDTGNAISAYIDSHAPGNVPVYRYVVVSYRIRGRDLVVARAACARPAWWAELAGPSQLCHSIGTCDASSEPSQSRRNDCSFRFEYDTGARALKRQDG